MAKFAHRVGPLFMTVLIFFMYLTLRTWRQEEISIPEIDHKLEPEQEEFRTERVIPIQKIAVEKPLKACETRDTCKHISCLALIEGDIEEQRKAKLYMQFYPRKTPKDSTVIEMTENCTAYRLSRQYPWGAGSPMEADFPIAYSILMHQDAAQIERLLRVIYQPQNSYCIHIDAKAPQVLHQAIQSLVNCFPNVFIASKLETIVYAGFSRLQADINCMKDLIQRGRKWKYFINLVGQVLPLRTNRELVRILQVYNGANDIEGLPMWRRATSRYTQKWQESRTAQGKLELVKVTNVSNPPAPHQIEVVRGSAYGIFSRAFVEFILTDEKAKDLLEWSRYTWSPDELYWATLNHVFINPQLKTPGGYQGLPDRKPWNAVYASWYPRDPCHGRNVRGVCIFGVGDLPQLVERKEMFANKFYLDHQYLTFDCLEEWLHNKTVYPLPMQIDFYRQLPFVFKGKYS